MPTKIVPIPQGDLYKSCNHPEHNPPSHISIPFGCQMEHTCPQCGKHVVIRSNEPMLVM